MVSLEYAWGPGLDPGQSIWSGQNVQLDLAEQQAVRPMIPNLRLLYAKCTFIDQTDD